LPEAAAEAALDAIDAAPAVDDGARSAATSASDSQVRFTSGFPFPLTRPNGLQWMLTLERARAIDGKRVRPALEWRRI